MSIAKDVPARTYALCAVWKDLETATAETKAAAGGEDPAAKSVVWCPFDWHEGSWKPLEAAATAKGKRLTVFIEIQQIQGNEWNAKWMDDVELRRQNASPSTHSR